MEDTTPEPQIDQTTGEVMPTVPATLNEALIAARRAVHALVFKANEHKGQGGYTYVSHEQVLIHARDALLSHGLLLEQRSVAYDGELTVPTQRGESRVWRWTGAFALVHERGEERPYVFAATTQPNDKGAFVASTSLDRVAHMRVLQLAGTKDENAESDWHDHQPGGVEHGAEARQTPQAPPHGRGPARRTPSNVVQLRAPETPQDALAQVPDKYRAGLATMQENLQRVRAPEALIEWWVSLSQTLPELQREPERKRAAWQLFVGHVADCDLDVRAIAQAIDARIAQAKKNGGA